MFCQEQDRVFLAESLSETVAIRAGLPGGSWTGGGAIGRIWCSL